MADKLRDQIDQIDKLKKRIDTLKEAALLTDTAMERDTVSAKIQYRQSKYEALIETIKKLAAATLQAHAPDQMAAGDLKAAHRTATMATHPDRQGNAEQFKDVHAAFGFLNKQKPPEVPVPPAPAPAPPPPPASGALVPGEQEPSGPMVRHQRPQPLAIADREPEEAPPALRGLRPVTGEPVLQLGAAPPEPPAAATPEPSAAAPVPATPAAAPFQSPGMAPGEYGPPTEANALFAAHERQGENQQRRREAQAAAPAATVQPPAVPSPEPTNFAVVGGQPIGGGPTPPPPGTAPAPEEPKEPLKEPTDQLGQVFDQLTQRAKEFPEELRAISLAFRELRFAMDELAKAQKDETGGGGDPGAATMRVAAAQHRALAVAGGSAAKPPEMTLPPQKKDQPRQPGFFERLGSKAGQPNSPASNVLGTAGRGADAGIGHAATGASAAAAGLAAIHPAAQAVVAGLSAVANASGTLGQALQPFSQAVEKFDPGLVAMLNQALEDLTASAGSMFTPIIEAGIMVADTLNALFTQIAPVVLPMVQQVVDVLQQLAVQVINGVVPIFEALAPIVQEALNALLPLAAELTPIFNVVIAVVLRLVEALRPLVTKQLADLVQGFKILGPIVSMVAEVIGEFMVMYIEIYKALFEVLKPITDALMPVFKTVLTALIDTAKDLAAAFGAAAASITFVARNWALAIASNATEATRTAFWGTVAAEFSANFRRIRDGTTGTNPPVRPQLDPNNRTIAARPASVVGIEQMGAEARQAAFGARSAADQRAEMISLLQQQLGRWDVVGAMHTRERLRELSERGLNEQP